jgi:hypothetical protein
LILTFSDSFVYYYFKLFWATARDHQNMTIVSIGEVLWDVFEEGEKLGGAPFNFSVHASRLGHRVVFVSAVGHDARGRRTLRSPKRVCIAWS